MKKINPFVISTIMFICLNILVLSSISFKNNLQKNFFRLHITANSNHIDDQIIKIRLMEHLKTSVLNNVNYTNKNSIKNYFKTNSNNILNEINNFLRENNLNYTAKLKIGKCYYDKKESKTYNMPAGAYDSINIVLGKGYGKNMWTILYNENEEISKSLLPLSNSYNEDVEYSFYTIEILNKIAAKFN